MNFLLLLEGDVDEVNDDDLMNIQGIPGPAGLEHHRRIENIQGTLYIYVVLTDSLSGRL